MRVKEKRKSSEMVRIPSEQVNNSNERVEAETRYSARVCASGVAIDIQLTCGTVRGKNLSERSSSGVVSEWRLPIGM